MHRRIATLAFSTAILVGSLTAGIAQAAGPTLIRDAYTETFFDDFLFDLCGISTMTTVTERWTRKEFPDGSTTLQTVRTFVPDDERIPIEKGAATSFIAPDGSRTVVGKPLQLFDRNGGVTTLDAGLVMFNADGDLTTVRGRHDFIVDGDEAALYCP